MAPPPAPIGASWTPTLAEEFTGTALNNGIWYPMRNRFALTPGAPGYEDGEEQLFVSSAVTVGGGRVTLTARRTPGEPGSTTYGWESGILTTGGATAPRRSFTPPMYVEVLLTVPAGGPGFAPTIKLIPATGGEQSETIFPHSAIEWYSEQQSLYLATRGQGNAGNGIDGTLIGGDLAGVPHTLGIEWLPNRVRFYLDGVLVHVSERIVPTGSAILMIALGVGGLVPGSSPDTPSPTTMSVDSVNAWSLAYTEGLYASPEPYADPPRVRLDLVGPANASTVTVTRIDPGGGEHPVRVESPPVLSGGRWTGYDYESAFSTLIYTAVTETGVMYRTAADTAPLRPDCLTTWPESLPQRAVWVRHPTVPDRSALLVVNRDPARPQGLERAVFRPPGRRFPVVYTAGSRQAPTGTLTVVTATAEEEARLAGLLADGSPLLLTVPPEWGWGWDHRYIAIGEAVPNRSVAWLDEPTREWSLAYEEVARPPGGMAAEWTCGLLEAAYATCGDAQDAYVTCGDMETNTVSGAVP